MKPVALPGCCTVDTRTDAVFVVVAEIHLVKPAEQIAAFNIGQQLEMKCVTTTFFRNCSEIRMPPSGSVTAKHTVRHLALSVFEVMYSQAKLFQVVFTLSSAGRLTSLLNCR